MAHCSCCSLSRVFILFVKVGVNVSDFRIPLNNVFIKEIVR